MNKGFLNTAILLEEKRSTILYFGIIYVVGLIYHFFYYYFMAHYEFGNFRLDKFLLLLFPYLILTLFIPIILLFLKSKHLSKIKYIGASVYVSSILLIDFVNYHMTGYYDSGNISEIFMVILSSIFVNQLFFWLVASSLIFKYLLVAIIYPEILHTIVLPLGLVSIITILGYVILNRFISYVNSINNVYNDHFNAMVKGIVTILELKDPHTRGHSERVAKYSVTLARKVGKFSEHELATFYNSCLLHDIGKIQISDDILTKPDRLTEDEYEVVKMHTVFGSDAVKEIESLQPCIEIIRHHHERWDGTGYPDQLKGEEIPLLTRICTIADAFDAMTSHRAYRAALTPDEAYSRIVKGGGTQFDPNLIQPFKNVFPTWLSILHDYHEAHEEEYRQLHGSNLYSLKGVNL